MPPPSNLKHAHTFLQTSSWFRKFIPNFATIAKPLNDLLKENAAWEWRPEQQEAFETLKDRLTTAPILQQTERTRALTQSELPSSKGRRTNKNQSSTPADYSPLQNGTAYTITEREALAIVWAVNKFRGYIGENTSVVITDHQLLRWLMTLKKIGQVGLTTSALQPDNTIHSWTNKRPCRLTITPAMRRQHEVHLPSLHCSRRHPHSWNAATLF
jgi:hypothetical protein